MSIPNQRLRTLYRIGLVVISIVLAIVWQHMQAPHGVLLETTLKTVDVSLDKAPIQAIPATFIADPAKFRLGEQLFQDARLSKDGQVACIRCHKLDRGGVDGKQYSTGLNGALTTVNTPTIFNVAYNFQFNWDGQHKSLAVHTDKLMQNPKIMGADWSDIQQKLAAIDEYKQAFETVYENGISKDNVIDAIVTYETNLVTPNARFDRYLNGDLSALSAVEQEGYRWFNAYGCVSCHQGVNVGGNMFQKFGVIGDYFADRGNIQDADSGRFNVTQDEADRYVFRVPSLRNVAATPPYLHDGTAKTLEEAIGIMVKYQLGRPIPAEHVEAIAQFLQTLTGEYNGVPITSMTNVMANP